MVFFPNTNIELWEYGENEEIPNFFGETTSTYTLIGVYCGDFQNMSPKDKDEAYGKTLEDTYKIYFDPTVPITDTMILRKQGETDTYTINGTPQHYQNLIPHIKVTVQKQRKPTKLE